MLLNKPRLLERMKDFCVDVLIATSPENVTYVSGFWALPQWIRRGPQVYAVWPLPDRGEPEIITGTSTLDLIADQNVDVAKVRRYGEFHVEVTDLGIPDAVDGRHMELRSSRSYEDAFSALASALDELDIANTRIAIDESGIDHSTIEKLKDRFPSTRWLPAAAILRDVRAVKTAEEIERLRTVARIAERAVHAALSVAQVGATEMELARAFHTQTVQDDALPVLGCIGFGQRGALMNVQPSARRLKGGEVIRFDVGGRFRHYRADIARNAVIGALPSDVVQTHAALLEGVRRGADAVRPGVPAAKVFETVMETVRMTGLPNYIRDHVGHGIGLDGYDAPILSARSADVIEEGMVVCIETPYYRSGEFGIQVEDMFVVRRDGAELLTETDGALIEMRL
ncbi:Xaa-Pro aminopeptidase [Rhizobiales bacterium GAS188]|nr:Xaa-Pro aminopeptidase [Rhizobiales bacterium GAS188]